MVVFDACPALLIILESRSNAFVETEEVMNALEVASEEVQAAVEKVLSLSPAQSIKVTVRMLNL